MASTEGDLDPALPEERTAYHERRLIVNADDFGLTLGVNQGILRAHREGIVSSTTLLVNMPSAVEAADLLRSAPGLGVGLHLNLTTGLPVLPTSEVTSLVDLRGRFRKDAMRLRFSARPSEVLQEWEAQLARFRQLVGRDPTHLDSHHHIHLVPRFTRVLLELAARHSISAVRAIAPQDVSPPPPGVANRVGAWAVRRWLRRSYAMLAAAGLARPQATRVLTPRHTMDDVLVWLEELPSGTTELVCHPGTVDLPLRQLSGKLGEREAELTLLCHPALPQVMRTVGVRLATFADLQSTLS